MANNKYSLTLRIDFDALDDIQAREMATKELIRLGIDPATTNRPVKLQKLQTGAPPVKVPLGSSKVLEVC